MVCVCVCVVWSGCDEVGQISTDSLPHRETLSLTVTISLVRSGLVGVKGTGLFLSCTCTFTYSDDNSQQKILIISLFVGMFF